MLLFIYDFGGAVHVPGVAHYIDYLLPGITDVGGITREHRSAASPSIAQHRLPPSAHLERCGQG